MSDKKKYHFISHTHWDREWYRPFEVFRYRLANLIDKLLDLLDREPEFRYFHLDGQTIVLEDYFTLRPGNKDRLEHYIKEGSILIGPWYQQNDLFLTSAESTVRNLMEGISISRKLGGEMKVGYLPDHFGIIGQMPQILQDIGIDNCVHGRGYDNEKHKSPFFRWRSPDGSEVTSLHLYYWYNSAQRLSTDSAQLKLVFDKIREREEKINTTSHHAMMNGVDHLEAQEDLSEALDNLRQIYGGEIDIIHDALPNYVKGVKDYMDTQPEETYPVVQGELREGPEYSILAGTLSSRIYIKQANMECHDLVEKWMEPLSVWCAAMDLDPYEADTIHYYWKLYMENHPHDSICGCSQDAVHDHMMDRFQCLKELAGEVIDRKMTVIAEQINNDNFDGNDQKLVVFNTAQVEYNQAINTTVYFLDEDQVQDFSIEDEMGNSLPYRIISDTASRILVTSPINLPEILKVKRFDLEWQAKAPALGYAAYRVRPGQNGIRLRDETMNKEQINAPVLENEYLKVEVQYDGTFNIYNKKTGVVLKNQGQVQDAGDRGDLYVFSEVPDESYPVWKGPVEVTSCIINDLYHKCVYRFTWNLPISLDDAKQKRSSDTVACDFLVTLCLNKGAEWVNVEVEVNNRVKDHRLRLLFPGAVKAGHVLAGSQFDVVRREWDYGREWKRDANSQPCWKWFAPVYDDGGTAIFAKGLLEYEMIDEGRTAAVTILRCTETINVRDEVFLEQDVHPKGQCMGSHTFKLAVRPFLHESPTRLYREAELFHQGIRTKLCPLYKDRWSKGSAWLQDTEFSRAFKLKDPNEHKPRLPLNYTFMELKGDAMISALKWSEDGLNPILRLYNVEQSASSIELASEYIQEKIVIANLLEEPSGMIPVGNKTMKTELGAKKIVTFRI